MELLKTGCQYDLLANSASAGTESVLHVKLTDAALKAIEEYCDRTRKLKGAHDVRQTTIQFTGNNGVIHIPIQQSSDTKTFAFSLSSSEQKDGSLECIQQSAKLRGSVVSVGVMSHTLRVQATEDVYQTTKEKMTLADEEVKKVRAKEIKHSGPNIGKRVVKKSSGVTNHSRRTTEPSSPLPAPPTRARGRPPRTSYPQKSSTEVVDSMKRKSDVMISDNSPSTSASDKHPLRDRVIHLLAVRAYKRPELILRLQNDGVRPDKNTLGAVLDVVAQQHRDSLTLHRHLYATDVRQDWPLYGDEDRRVLSRKLSQLHELPVTESPALSPCISVTGRDSPATDLSSHKRSSSAAKTSCSPVSKRRRSQSKSSSTTLPVCNGSTATNSSSSSVATATVVNTRRRLSSAASNGNTTVAADGLHEKLLQNPQLDDFTDHYPPVTSDSERHRYKADFFGEYSQYLRLHNSISQQMKTFSALTSRLKQAAENSLEYENVKSEIYAEYKKLQSDASYADDRRLCDYLHRKLSHIKHVVQEYDQSRLAK